MQSRKNQSTKITFLHFKYKARQICYLQHKVQYTTNTLIYKVKYMETNDPIKACYPSQNSDTLKFFILAIFSLEEAASWLAPVGGWICYLQDRDDNPAA